MANGFGGGIIYSVAGMTVSNLTASVVDATFSKDAEIKEATDSSNAFLGAYKGKQKRVWDVTAIMQSTGSAIALPELLTTATVVNPYCSEATGNWAVYKSSFEFKSDNYSMVKQQLVQLVTAAGTTLP